MESEKKNEASILRGSYRIIRGRIWLSGHNSWEHRRFVFNCKHNKNVYEPIIHYLYVVQVSALDLNLLKKKPLKWLKIFKRYSC